MSVRPDPPKPLGEAIKELLDDRPHSCDFYHSQAYEDNRSKQLVLIGKIERRIGKKLCNRIFKDYFDVELLEGEFHAGLQESAYRLGFSDGLQLANQINEAGKGHLNIFTGSNVT